MQKKTSFVLSVISAAVMLLAACAPAARPAATSATAVTAAAPSAAAALPDGSAIKAGLVTDTGGVNDTGFNQLAREGMQKAAMDMGFQVKYIEPTQPADYGKNIDALAAEGCSVIITIGSPIAAATAEKALQYPDIRFAVIDHAFSDDGPANVTSLMFAEDQAGFLAGVLAGGMSKKGFVCSVSSLRTPQSERYVKSFHAGAAWQAGPELRIMNNYINIRTANKNVPTFEDSTRGKETALRLIGQGCDVIFGVGGDAVKGALVAAGENNLPAIGADVDRYHTDPELQPALISSAMKNVDVAVYTYLKSVADGSVRDGISTSTLDNGGVGLAPFHEWDARIPAGLKARIQKAARGIRDGSIRTQ